MTRLLRLIAINTCVGIISLVGSFKRIHLGSLAGLMFLNLVLSGCGNATIPNGTGTPGIVVVNSSTASVVEMQTATSDGLIRSYYYYVDGERVGLSPSLQWISVKFASNDPVEQSLALRDSSIPVDPLKPILQIPNPELVMVPLQNGIQLIELMRLISLMRAQPSTFLQANPVFEAGETKMVMTDEFIATFPTEKNQTDIEALNSYHKVEIVELILGQHNTFVLRVLPAARSDALTMANLYQESGVAIHAAPNFVSIVPGN